MTAAIPGLEEAIEAAYRNKPSLLASPDMDLDSGLGDWCVMFEDANWERWPCEDDDCPARPGWDIALSEQGNVLRSALAIEVETLIRQRLSEFAERFQAEHPEAVLRTVEVAAA